MSRVYFHSPSGEAELPEEERWDLGMEALLLLDETMRLRIGPDNLAVKASVMVFRRSTSQT